MKKSIVSVLAVAMLLTSCSHGLQTSDTDNSYTSPTEETYSAAASLTTEEKVAQLLMTRCDSSAMDSILEKHPGGIVMFAVDFDGLSKAEVKKKIKAYKSQCDITPIIAVDEEGGTVVRVSSNPSLSPTKFESPRYYYENGGMDAVKENAAEKSALLSELGITMNLAPVADVSTNPEDFIYDRSLGESAEITAQYTSVVVSAAKDAGEMSCLKHFPGYGNNVDTHTGIAIDNRTLDSLRENDFLPFESGIAAGSAAVLVSHNIITDVDSEEPASISPKIHEILRDELGFDGIIMTDDMSMQAMAEYDTPYTKAVLAGNDMLIVSDFSTAYDEILSAVLDGTIPTDMLDNAVNRILKVKNEYNL